MTLIASEALAVVTVMPLVARDLHGLSLYGWVFSSFMLASLIGIVVAGRDADRHGPARAYVAGLILFAAGLVVAGLAPSMGVLVVGRVLQGLGAGAVPAVAYVVIGRSLPEALHPRMMAMLDTAWVVPGIAGPGVAAAVAHVFSWRWVFLGLLPLVAITGPMALPALIRLGRPDGEPAMEHKLLDGLRIAAGATLVLGALSSRQVWLGVGLGLLGILVGLPSLRRLLPARTLTAAPGLPATILCIGLLTFAFFGADAYVTLTITTVRHHSTAIAGIVVTASTLSWTAGSWFQTHFSARWQGRRLVRCGLSCVLIGTAGMAWQLHHGVPLAEAFVAWCIGGFGIGLAFAPVSLMMLRTAPSGREGWASASLNLAEVLGIALGIGVGGAAVTSAAHGSLGLPTGVALAYGAAAVTAVIGLLVSGRLPDTLVPSPASSDR
jgi:MFS family permease